MSGSSIDGLDICFSIFWQTNQQWKFQIVAATTIEYSTIWKDRLLKAAKLNGRDLALLDREYGTHLGELADGFLKKNDLEADLISSHGHTIFHQTDKNLSYQIGHGAFIAAATGKKVVSDLRSLDTALGGEGAPLVPVAEKYLFPNSKLFLNIGGIANVSIHTKKEDNLLGFDICIANQALNNLTKKHFGKEYDPEGSIAKSGNIVSSLLNKLAGIEFYQQAPPKSLGREFFENSIMPLIEDSSLDPKNILCTFTNHIANEIESAIQKVSSEKSILISGGGAHNLFLMELLKQKGFQAIETSIEIIDNKEALSFAFLGLLRYLEIDNVHRSVTGASRNNCGGSIYIS